MRVLTGAGIGSAAVATAVVAAILLTTDGSGSSGQQTSEAVGRSSAALQERPLPRRAPLAIVGRTLARLDPRTLAPRGPRVKLPEYHDTWSFSPDGSRVALGMGSPSAEPCGAGVCIVDVDSMKVTRDVEMPIAAEAVAWPQPRRVIAVLQSGQVVVADPLTGKTLRRERLGVPANGPPSAAGPGGGLVVLLGDDPLQLVSIDSRGQVNVARLDRLRLGDNPRLPPERAGLAVDPSHERALVFAAAAPAAEVDLRSMQVRYHDLSVAPGVPASAGRSVARLRYAEWVGRGRVAVFGEDVVSDGGARTREVPAGVHSVDTETWATRTLQPRANRARLAASRLLAYTTRPSAVRPAGVGLRIYTRAGRQSAHLFGDETMDVQSDGGTAYALTPAALRIVRVRSGRAVRNTGASPSPKPRILSSRLGSGYRP